MAEEENIEQKTEEPSAKRIQDAEEKGNFAHSREVTSAFVLLAAILAFAMAGSLSTRQMMGTWHNLFSQAHAVQFNLEDLRKLLEWVMKNSFTILSPILFSILVGGLIANLVQTGGIRFSLHPLLPRFHKLNPLNGFKRLFSRTALMELFKSIFKVTLISLIAFFTIKGRFDEIPPMMGLSVGQILVFMGKVGLEIMIKVLIAMIFLAFIDYLFQRFTYLRNLRMTKQEVKDERKDTEGNPQIKQRVRNVQMEMMKRRMMAAVPEADVVVTNPTHISVAIQYDQQNFDAPVVVAKGKGVVAEKIRELAREHDIPVVEDKPLARLLYQTVEIGQMIPSNLYKAVAEILAYVYRLKGKSLV
ncbi:MAG: flagellar biosynthesis protein FlhB [Nitrospinaceae bacterium]|nr:flagellar biosynthesis protein FlhB [Nitrospinaceae bacterium]NIR54994.1 flagellar biosynthesis protein FlhB [Nitrospinaceae bacterium]NIT82234.1 flagellar biosynthesis protein FlhB [Nitrospinaceae bacterium]NIX34619.1 flagellar biosynthesis protein FlhB [Nitrospinaceae bacterium]NIY15451.1 flagellar biosynthesis protein FlhB [Nitrospinaceae bacterium]